MRDNVWRRGEEMREGVAGVLIVHDAKHQNRPGVWVRKPFSNFL